MSTTHVTREALINDLLQEIIIIENRRGKDKDRGYVLDLLAEIANAVDGKRPQKPMNINPAVLAAFSGKPPQG